jgi:hypothetical protein
MNLIQYSDYDGRGKRFDSEQDKMFSSSPHRPDRFWCRPSLQSNGYRKFLLKWKSDRAVMLTTGLHLVK